jgi:hypothetical protein
MQGQVPDEKTPTNRWTERPTGALVGVPCFTTAKQRHTILIFLQSSTFSSYYIAELQKHSKRML